MELYEKKLSGDVVFEGRIIKVIKDKVELPNGKTSTREVVLHGGGACILAINSNDEVYFVKQYRYSLGKVLLELPAGKIENHDAPEATALRELAEEVGLHATTIHSLGYIAPTCGYCSELIYMYYTDDFSTTEVCPDEDEFLEIVTLPLEKALEKIDNHEIEDAKTIVALLKYSRLKNNNK